MNEKGKKTPVILDTDIGSDIDDTWALVMMLKSPELDVKLITTDTADTTYRTKIVAKLLEIAGRTDIPIGIGTKYSDETGGQKKWVSDYDLSKYPGKIYDSSTDALTKTIMDSPEPVTLICIGPVPDISLALKKEPGIVKKSRFVGMHGSIRKGYWGEDKVSAESNVKQFTKQCQDVFTAEWDMTITPLDTCGIVVLKGEKYRKVRQCKDPLTQALIENYRIWSGSGRHRNEFEYQSSVLYDTVAIYLAFSEELLKMEKLNIRVTDDGFTVIDKKARLMNCAMEWKDLSAFENLLVKRLTSQVS